jgi:flagellar protein FliS
VASAVDNATPHQLIKMMFDGALARLKRARGCVAHNDIPGRSEALDGALSIIGALQGCLDHEQGGQLAGHLDSLYDYMQRRLFRAIVENDIEPIDEVTDLVTTLKEAWDAIDSSALAQPLRQPVTAP